MAREAPPQDHRITRARADTPCATCGTSIAEAELALSEAYVSTDGKWARSHRYARSPKPGDHYDDDGNDRHRDDSPNADLASRLHHLACGATHQPYKLRSAMKLSGDAIPNRAALEEQILDTLTPKDNAQRDPATRDKYADFIERLRETADDNDFLVFGDWLQSVGDPRGELIAVQHKLETAINEDRAQLVDHERKLLAIHKLGPEQPDGTLRWRRGFVRRVVKPFTRTDHPAFVFLRDSDIVDSETPERAVPVKPAKSKVGGEWLVRHTRKPEWGVGRVIAETETAGLEVEFEHGGKRSVKNVELLEDVE